MKIGEFICDDTPASTKLAFDQAHREL